MIAEAMVACAAFGPGAVGIGMGLVGWMVNRPRVDHSPVRDVLILAAHSDDCVVCAGEYAIEAAAAGRQICVAYLTCGDYEVGTPRAITRTEEARACWRSVGVPDERIVFINLPCSRLGGPAAQHSDAAIAQASEMIERLLMQAPANSAVFFPAEGESHSDHRLLRRLTMQALDRVKRTDLAPYESPEYNPYVSLWHTPFRALSTVMRWIPVLSRFNSSRHPSLRAGFVRGRAGVMRPHNAARLNRKRELFKYFVSENPKKLVEYFGNPDLYRAADPSHRTEVSSGYVLVGSRYLDVLTLMVVWSVVLVQLFAAMAVGEIVRRMPTGTAIGWCVAVVGLVVLGFGMMTKGEAMRKVSIGAAGAGFICGGLGLAALLMNG